MGDQRRVDASEAVTVSPVQPAQAAKPYRCPGCDGVIPPGIFHLVVVPVEAADLRRHWHSGCWYKETRRRGAQHQSTGVDHPADDYAAGSEPNGD